MKLLPLFAIIISIPCLATAGFGFKPDGSLNKPEISHAFFEGEFSRILIPLEAYRRSFPATATRDDSVFVYKYLSVIYAADPSTRQKAESYMFQLVKMNPTIEIIDLYVSDTIESIFKNVKKSYLDREQYMQTQEQQDISHTQEKKPRSKRWVGWTLGGVGLAAVVAGTFYVLNDDSKPQIERVTLPLSSEE